MDQLKDFLGLVKRQHFWFLAPVVLALGIVGWMMAARQLTEQFDKYRSEVNNYKTQMEAVSSQQQHPNPEFHTGQQLLNAERAANVRQAWQLKWDRQKTVLQWPGELPADLRAQVEQMRPIETVDTQKNQIPQSLRAAYGSYIKDELPKLAQRIGAKWEPATGGRRRRAVSFGEENSNNEVGIEEGRGGGGFRGNDVTIDETTIVRWDPENQAAIETNFDWGARPPSTFEVLYAQEDLWVLNTLADIIADTNSGARTRAAASVKEILFIQIGKDVKAPEFQVVRPTPLAMEAGSDETASTTTSAEPPPAQQGDMIPGQKKTGLDSLVENRYVDQDYKPIADLENLLALVEVAKRIPVRMRLKVDQRQINRLLVNCANSSLTFEVRQLRFNPQGDGQGLGQRNFGGDEGFGDGFSSTVRVKRLPDYQTFDRYIELFGIVYIFNPVDDSKLGTGNADEITADNSSTIAR